MSGTPKALLSCPDCQTPALARIVYVGEGRWVFAYSCENGRCPNHGYQYQGEVHEIDQPQPTQAHITEALGRDVRHG